MKINIGGLAVSVSVPFCALIAILLIIDKTGCMIHSLIAIILHETGHLIAMKMTRCLPKEISFRLGGLIIIGGVPQTHKKKAVIILSGPITNIAAAIFLFIVGRADPQSPAYVGAVTEAVVGIFNLLPIRGLDGGTVLYHILSLLLPESRASIISYIISIIFTVLVLGIGVTVLFNSRSNPTLLILGIYLSALNIPRFGLGEPLP